METTYFWPRLTTYGYGGGGGYFCHHLNHFHYVQVSQIVGRMGQVSRTRSTPDLTLDSCFQSATCSTAYVAVTASVSLLAISSYVIFVLFTLRYSLDCYYYVWCGYVKLLKNKTLIFFFLDTVYTDVVDFIDSKSVALVWDSFCK